MNRVLLIAYLFPPAGGVGVLRALSFAKYLPQFGHEVHVLAARNPTVPTVDGGLLRQVPPEVRVHRAISPELPFHFRQKLWRALGKTVGSSRNAPPANQSAEEAEGKFRGYIRQLFSPDPEVVWVPFALRKARRIIRRYGIEVVIVTVPPFSSLMIGTTLKREFPSIKLISDFRDEWFQFHLSVFEFHKNAHAFRRAREIEAAAARSSDLVVSVVPSIIEQMRGRHPDQAAEKFAVVHNGFDPQLAVRFQPRPHGPGKVIVTFVGTIYGASTLRYYLAALAALPEQIRARFETRLIGRIAEEELPLVKGAAGQVQILGFMPQAEAYKWMEETDYLLLTMTDPSCITGKFFDYLATGKPMLALTPDGGEVQRMLAETCAGWWADYRNQAAVEELLNRAHDAVMADAVPVVPTGVAERFSRVKIAGELSRRIHLLTAASRTAVLTGGTPAPKY